MAICARACGHSLGTRYQQAKPRKDCAMTTCATCRFCTPHPTDSALVQCRRMPPTVTTMAMGQWPVVRPDAWCGEWRAVDGRKNGDKA